MSPQKAHYEAMVSRTILFVISGPSAQAHTEDSETLGCFPAFRLCRGPDSSSSRLNHLNASVH
jgi:hypothetical protein